MNIALAVLTAATLALAACGVDGPPEAPRAAQTGISVTGDASIGMRTDDL